MLIGDLKQKFSSFSGGIMFDFLRENDIFCPDLCTSIEQHIFDLELFLIMGPSPCYSPYRGVYRIEYPPPQSSRDS